MDLQQEMARRFVNELLRATGWAPSRMARAAHISHTTLTRFLNNEDVTHTLSDRTLGKIRAAAATEIPEEQIDTLWLLAQRHPAHRANGRQKAR
jgi:hypothetical protein